MRRRSRRLLPLLLVALLASCGSETSIPFAAETTAGDAVADAGGHPSATDVPFTPDVGVDAAPDVAPADTAPEEIEAPDTTADTAPDVGQDTETPPGPSRAEAMAELRASVLSLNQAWRFRLDPDGVGVDLGWAAENHPDGDWETLDAGLNWEDQGHPDYDGVAWYRKRVEIPAKWVDSGVRLAASGVDDEYDVYVNGVWVRHFGEAPDRSVWGWRTYTRVDDLLRFGEENLIAIRVVDWGMDGGIWRDIQLRRAAPLAPWRELLPEPILDDRPEWVELYWEAWRMAWEKISFGTADNGFADAYMDEGFNEQVYQWDSSFICLFARWGRRLFPVMATLDNFYGNQRPDGYIQRVYSETTGGELGDPTPEEPMVNPPLFAWVEWEWYRATGDRERLAAVRPTLEAYWRWLADNVRAPEGQGLYYQTDLGSGMDNTPRGNMAYAGWADMSSQQALAALCLARMAEALGDEEGAATWSAEHAALVEAINRLTWSEGDQIYYDLEREGWHSGVKHIGAFWAFLGEVATDSRATKLAETLADPDTFWRAHPFPALAASDPHYDPAGHYWRGGVWAPTNYMAVKGLDLVGERDLAREAAERHIEAMATVFTTPPADEARLAPEERDGEYATIWECYAPDAMTPATRWDATWYSRQDFVGWSGLGPIAMLIEDVIGLDVDGVESHIVWHLTRTDRHGVQRLPLGAAGLASLVAETRAAPDAHVTLTVETDTPFTLEVRLPGHEPSTHAIAVGAATLSVP